MNCRLQILTAILLALPLSATLAQTPHRSAGTILQEYFFVQPGDTLVKLSHPFVTAGSDSLWFGKRLLRRGREYRIREIPGEIHLLFFVPHPDTLRVKYRALAIGLKPSYQYLPFVPYREEAAPSVASSDAAAASSRKIEPDPFAGSSLRKNGSITRSVSVGNRQGLRVDSGLRLQLEGNLTPGVRVVAALSDQNTPIQPEGTTQSLQEIDRVYIQLEGPKFDARLGDFSVQYQVGRFGRYQRKLQGAMIHLKQGTTEVTVAGAVSRGKFHTNRFRGEEGRQGPYQLRGQRGETEIIVLAGTERVWVDGELMTRGEENDYIIEYSTGQITFTRKRLITSDSRIEVDFEYSDLKFPRNLYNLHFATSLWAEKLKLGGVVIRESDDLSNPLEGELTKSDRKILAGIGDQLDRAFVESGQYVGEGKGSYVRADSAGSTFFRYVGPENGDYLVRFSYVGEGLGQYRYAGQGRYEYVGEGAGNYTARRYLPVAQSQNLGSLFLQFTPTKRTAVTAEMALSQSDLNRFSPLDDADNLGTALQIRGRVQSVPLRLKNHSLGVLQFDALIRKQDDRFVEITRNQEVEYDRKWDLSDPSARGEWVQEINGNYSPLRGASLRLQLGRFRRGDYFRSARRLFEVNLKRTKWPALFYREERIGRQDNHLQIDGDWIRRLGRLHVQLWKLQPFLRYEAEQKQDRSAAGGLTSGFAFEDVTAGASLRIARPLELSLAFNGRRDRTVDRQVWQDRSTARGKKIGLTLKRWQNLQFHLMYTDRLRRYHSGGQNDKHTRLTDLTFSYTPLRRALQTSVRFQMTAEQISRTEQFYFKVEEGRGSYRFDPELNEYVPDVFGDYILRTLSTGEFEPVNDVFLNWKLSFKPKLIWGTKKIRRKRWQRWISNIKWDTYFSLNEKSRKDSPWQLPISRSGVAFEDSLTVYGRAVFRQDLYLFENIIDRSLRLRWMETMEENNRLTEGGQQSLRQEQSLRYTARLNRRFSLEAGMARRYIQRLFAAPGRVDRKILSRSGKLRLSYRPRSNIEIALNGRIMLDEDRVYTPATRVVLNSFKPNVNYSFRGKGRLRAEFEFADVRARPDDRLIPYEMADGRRVGRNFRWQVSLDYRLSAKMMIFFSYLGRREPGRDETLHLGKAEVKAFF